MNVRVIAEFSVDKKDASKVIDGIDGLVSQLNSTSYRGPGFKPPIKKYRRSVRGLLSIWKKVR